MNNETRVDILHNPRKNKGTAFSRKEREQLKLKGLLPPKIESIDQQFKRCLEQFGNFKTPIEKYVYLQSLKERNETLFYYFAQNHFERVLPIVYTPTVGEACQKFGHLWRAADGMYICPEYKGQVSEILNNWEAKEVKIIVISDGSRILGLGDLGANGMGIPIGKSSLYVGVGGFQPTQALPILLDAGTNNEKLLNDPLYLGVQKKRLIDDEYYPLWEEVLQSVHSKWPSCLIQFEDISNDHIFKLLETYQDKVLCFSDDIQGTGAVVVAGFSNGVKISGKELKEHKILIVGAGSAGIGVGDAFVAFLEDNGVKNASSKIYMTDSKGLITKLREDVQRSKEKMRFAREDVKDMKELEEIVKEIKPSTIIGVCGQKDAFTQEIIKSMSKENERPIIFALSNPLENEECTAKQAYEWSDGKAIFASGSPFDPVEYKGKTYHTGQGNNMFIFPGLGFGASLAKAKKVNQKMITAAATALADIVTKEELKTGKIYPDVSQSIDVSVQIAAAVMQSALDQGLAQEKIQQGTSLVDYVKKHMYKPSY